MRFGAPLLLLLAASPASVFANTGSGAGSAPGGGGSTEIKDAAAIKDRFGKKTLKQTTAVGFIPDLKEVDNYHTVAQMLGTNAGGIPFYHVQNRAVLDNIGVYGDKSVVALYRPWAGSKKFKVTFRGKLDSHEFKAWLYDNAFPPVAYRGGGFTEVAANVADKQKKGVLRLFVNSYIVDPDSKKPDDWDQPEQIDDPKAEKPDDWDDDEDGPWAAPHIANPEFKGPWSAPMISTLIGDPTDVKPEDWDQPEEIPDPKGSKPSDWDDEEDGEWSAQIIPNPAFKGNWTQKQILPPDEVDKLVKLATPVYEKFSKKIIVNIEDAYGSSKTMGYDFTPESYKEGTAWSIEFPTFSYNSATYKSDLKWQKFKVEDSSWSLMDFVTKWADGKITDIDKQQRQARKKSRLEKEAQEKKAKESKDDKGTEL